MYPLINCTDHQGVEHGFWDGLQKASPQYAQINRPLPACHGKQGFIRPLFMKQEGRKTSPTLGGGARHARVRREHPCTAYSIMQATPLTNRPTPLRPRAHLLPPLIDPPQVSHVGYPTD